MKRRAIKIERRLADRNEDAASRRWVWKLIGLAFLATAALYFLLTYFRGSQRGILTSDSWFGWPPATMHFCEELTHGLLVQPCNAISSLAFVVVGLYLFRIVRKKDVFLLFPISAVLVGITSFLYHASWTFFFQVFDVSSMFMLSCLLLSFNAWRLEFLTERRLPFVYAGLLVASILTMVTLKGRSGEMLFAVEVVVYLLTEAVLAKRRSSTRYEYFAWSFATFAVAFAIWILDVKEILCDAKNHYLQGHAVWHVLNAFCFYFLYRFYRQFRPDPKGA